MKVKVREAELLQVDLPFKNKFKHAITSRGQSSSVFVKLKLEGGVVGYGESLPREYVTGETTTSVVSTLKKVIPNKVIGYGVEGYEEVPSFVGSLEIERTAAKCALELALLDAYGRHFRKPVSSLMGDRLRDSVVYSGVMQSADGLDAIRKSLAFKVFGFKYVKIKVGDGDDLKRLKIARTILGDHVNIRVDANCAWNSDEAIERINEMRRFNISSVEQPVKGNDYDELKKVTDAVPEKISADESLCSVDDAARLADLGACNIFNIRISKCGGIIDSLKIAKIAQEANIGLQMGCQVGESGLLSAAGWHFACSFTEIPFCEGAYGKFLLRNDITEEDMTFKRGGVLKGVGGPGLGVNVIEGMLDNYATTRESFK